MQTTETIGKNVLYFDEIDSTNTYLKKIALEGASHGTAVIARSQSNGRGRLSREWISPQDSGIYMSVLLKPEVMPGCIQIITLGAAVAIIEAIENVTGMKAGIKWPNDILLGQKKVCGILTEMNSDNDKVNFLVVGIGINFSFDGSDFPMEIAKKATSILTYAKGQGMSTEGYRKDDMINAIFAELEKEYTMVEKGKTKGILEKWKKYSLTLGREVCITSLGNEIYGVAEDIADDGSLIVRCKDGIMHFKSGEASVRGLMGYV